MTPLMFSFRVLSALLLSCFFLPNLPCSNSCLDDFSGLDLSGATRLRCQASDVILFLFIFLIWKTPQSVAFTVCYLGYTVFVPFTFFCVISFQFLYLLNFTSTFFCLFVCFLYCCACKIRFYGRVSLLLLFLFFFIVHSCLFLFCVLKIVLYEKIQCS